MGAEERCGDRQIEGGGGGEGYREMGVMVGKRGGGGRGDRC